MVMEANFNDDVNTTYRPFGWNTTLSIADLKGMLSHWGIEMGLMYKFDKTMQEIDVESNQQFLF